MVLTTVICGQFVVSWKNEENEFGRNAVYLPLEGMTLRGVSERAEPQVVLPAVRAILTLRLLFGVHLLVWNESYKLVSKVLAKNVSFEKVRASWPECVR